MHVTTNRRQHGDRIYGTHLVRHSFRENGKVKNETLANLTPLPKETIELIKGSLAGDRYLEAGDSFEIERSLAHGHVAAVADRLGPPCSAPLAGNATSPLGW